MGILDFVFPKYCVNCRKIGSYICDSCFSYISFNASGLCAVCNRATFNELTHPKCRGRYVIDGIFTGIEYKGVAKKLIYAFKYKPYLTDLKSLLADFLYEALIQKEEFIKVIEQLVLRRSGSDNEAMILSPIPLHLRKRGYNQAEILANELSKKFNFKVINTLKRTKDTRSQVGLKREDRIKNISKAFSVLPNAPISKYPNIFLIDDVLTTGSTFLEAANVLKRNGVKRVWGIALARD